MPNCPKCNNIVDPQAITCPHCGNQLKGFGHPGIPLYQAEAGTYLCDLCYYHQDDSCNYPQRPTATSCTMFHDADTPLVDDSANYIPSGLESLRLWCDRNKGLLIVLGLVLFSVVLVLFR